MKVSRVTSGETSEAGFELVLNYRFNLKTDIYGFTNNTCCDCAYSSDNPRDVIKEVTSK